VKLRMFLSFALLCLSITFFGARAGSAQALQPIQPQEPAWLTQMYAEGWQKVQEGVLQRDSEEGQKETFTYGEEGLKYQVESLKRQVNHFQQLYNQHPSPELGDAIDHLQHQIAAGNERLRLGQAESPSSDQMNNCDISYGAHAYADYLRGSQAPGVSASADAYFHNNCGILGSTYAYAYVQGSLGSVFSTKSQEDPKSGGAWLDSAAQWTLSASSSCSSNSFARAWSDSLGVSYETSAQNSLCLPADFTVSIDGLSEVYTDNYNSPCADVTWTASASGGVPGYTYNWYIGGAYQGSGAQLTKRYCFTNTSVVVSVTAYDSASNSASASFGTNVYYTQYNACTSDPYSCECDSSYCCGGGGYEYPYRERELCPPIN
jgi:hypothetical protein